MSGPLAVLPERCGGAAENMAQDFLLLQRWPGPPGPRFRHYDWRGPAFTFGYSQKVEFIRSQLPPGESYDLCRRPTGGGLVDHRRDWTYALVVPRGHPWEEMRASESYRRVHESLASALRAQGVEAELQKRVEEPDRPPGPEGVCFQRAEVYDVVGRDGRKIAGAAQKRNKQGLLLQGSIWRPAAGEGIDWDRFLEDFPGELARGLGAKAEPAPWPEFAECELEALIEHYASPEWMEFR
ncbi:MAG: lipoate--protein ligase family protein [Opitutaceae bacterium]